MELMLEIISRQKFTARCDISYIFGKAGGYIGRSNECEWVLPDKNKQLSRKHALISCDGENFYIEDLSTNGIFTVVDKHPLPKGQRVHIEHGASYYFGEYTVQARLIHKPDAYIASLEQVDSIDLIPDDDYLDLDPLVAMEQQEEFEAKKRMGLYSDLLGASTSPQTLQDDHNEPRLDSMLSIKAIPEDWDAFEAQGIAQSHGLPKPHGPHRSHRSHGQVSHAVSGQQENGYQQSEYQQSEYQQVEYPQAEHTQQQTGQFQQSEAPVQTAQTVYQDLSKQQIRQTQQASQGQQSQRIQPHPVHKEHTILYNSPLLEEQEREVQKVAETDVFFTTLGFTDIPTEPEERERILKEAAEMLLASIDGLLQSLRNRADSKNDLRLPVTTMTLASNNPLKYSPTPQVALEHMLAANQDGLLPPSQAIVASFQDIHSHHLGILAGARAAVGAALHKISPEKVEGKLDADAPRRFNKSGKLWNTYARMHRNIVDNPDSFADFFLHDFARAYEMQVRTLHPIPGRNKGE